MRQWFWIAIQIAARMAMTLKKGERKVQSALCPSMATELKSRQKASRVLTRTTIQIGKSAT